MKVMNFTCPLNVLPSKEIS